MKGQKKLALPDGPLLEDVQAGRLDEEDHVLPSDVIVDRPGEEADLFTEERERETEEVDHVLEGDHIPEEDEAAEGEAEAEIKKINLKEAFLKE